MAEAETAAVKAALRNGAASESTVSTLQSLLISASSGLSAKPIAQRDRGKNARSSPQPLEKRAKPKSRNAQTVVVREDDLVVLPARQQYALATDAINACLKTLTDGLKGARNIDCERASPGRSMAKSRERVSRLSERALQARSSNSTPLKSTSGPSKQAARSSPSITTRTCRGPSISILHVAECGQHALSYLRSVDPKDIGIRDMPKWQLENAALAFAGKLIAHGLDNMAVEELRHVKRRLEDCSGQSTLRKDTKATGMTERPLSDKETIATLLRLNCPPIEDAEAIAVATTYHAHLLKIISSSRRPAVIEEAFRYLSVDIPNSPVDLAMRQLKDNCQIDKAAKRLDSVSRSVLNLCPNIASEADEAAKDPKRTPSPTIVFRLQMLALRIRNLSWSIAKHEPDVSKELLDPFWKCAVAFVRRSPTSTTGGAAYDLIARSFKTLGSHNSKFFTMSLFNIHGMLCSSAEGAHNYDEAMEWAQRLVDDCSPLEDNHVLRAVAKMRKFALLIKQNSSELSLEPVLEVFGNKMTGNESHYDLLLKAIAELMPALYEAGQRAASTSVLRLATHAALFSLQYSRSYPEKNSQYVRQVLETALRFCSAADELLTWVSEHAVTILIHAGVLETVADSASRKALSSAWTVSSTAVSLSRILQALALKNVRTHENQRPPLFFDDEQLQAGARGTLLELQLMHLNELTNKAKYHAALHKILPKLLRSINDVYSAAKYPIRRARVATVVWRLRQSHPELLSPDHLKSWLDTSLDTADLGKDHGLRTFREDVQATLAVSRSFSESRPSIAELKPSLLAWTKIINNSADYTQLREMIEDPKSLTSQLDSIATYLSMLGEDAACLATRIVLSKLVGLCNEPASASCHAWANLATQYLQLGYVEEARAILARVEPSLERTSIQPLAKLNYYVAKAECFAAMDEIDQCRLSLDQAGRLRSSHPPEKVSTKERLTYGLLHARAWLAHSKCSMESGSPHDALAAAKRSVKILNSLWAGVENSCRNRTEEPMVESGEPARPELDNHNGARKLELIPKDAKQPAKMEKITTNGASFWSLVPMLCKALIELSDVYSYHGLFHESNFYSERAIQVAVCVGSTALLSRVRSHRSCLLTLAEQSEDAELSLARDEAAATMDTSLALVDRYCAQAGIHRKAGLMEEAIALYDKAERSVAVMATDQFLARSEKFADDNEQMLEDRFESMTLQHGTSSAVPSVAEEVHGARKGRKLPLKSAKQKQIAKSSAVKSTTAARTDETATIRSGSCYVLQKIRGAIMMQKALVGVQLGTNMQPTLDEIDKTYPPSALLPYRSHAQYRNSMRRAMQALERDVIFNVLAESTLCMPALGWPQSTKLLQATRGPCNLPAARKTTAVAKSNAKASKRGPVAQNDPSDLLRIARDSLLTGSCASVHSHGTAHSRTTSTMLSSAGSLLAAITKPDGVQSLDSLSEGLVLEWPQIMASQYEQQAMLVDETRRVLPELLAWPNLNDEQPSAKVLTPAEFQEDFINILPKSLTAVSLYLNEDASELYIARYNSGQTPLIVRLPFSRHKPDGFDEEAFDYDKGKAELQEIIDLSNYSCHNPGDLEGKALKVKWWSEREGLDRRLHELLINIENIWLGGFKGIFAQYPVDADRLERFRRSFEDTLARYLPSRNLPKRQIERPSLDGKILELFIGLGDDHDGSVDLDEPLADLLYFVVDMLQFSGERNAYDEIDFDSMAVDVLDALRAYHEDGLESEGNARHLVLVLDRRLQAFPWESLPCLESSNTSRVGSMLALRECLVAQDSSLNGTRNDGKIDACTIPASGTYFLNPSSDLSRTQATLEPSLSRMTSDWNAIVDQKPDEDRFTSAITSSSILMYFGHGAGSQYIRPRVIRRLGSCCNVALLMGCSSGAIAEHGELEPFAVPLTYLLAGTTRREEVEKGGSRCKAVVATLWDVTDRDIDRFSLRLGEEWGLWPASEESRLPPKTLKKREVVAAPCTPQRPPKTPKTPKVHKTPGCFKTPAGTRTKPRLENGRKSSLVEAVSRSREACYLRYLNGAAPVVYGIPVYLQE